MTTTTLVVVGSPTLHEGMAELLRIADAVADAETIGAGVSVERHPSGWLVAAEPDFDVPPGMVHTYTLGAAAVLAEWDDPYPEVRHLIDGVAQHGMAADLVLTPAGAWFL